MEHDPIESALQEPQVPDAAEAKRIRDAVVGDLKWVLSNKRGRRFVWRLLETAGVFRQSFVPGDQYATAFNEGNRRYGLETLVLLHEIAPESYQLMLSEHHAARHDR